MCSFHETDISGYEKHTYVQKMACVCFFVYQVVLLIQGLSAFLLI